jgi:hypothetical protein
MSSPRTPLPGDQQPARQTNFGGTGNIYNFGGNIGNQWFSQHMAAHGFVYWLLHGIVALIAAAVWEYRHWLFHLLGGG